MHIDWPETSALPAPATVGAARVEEFTLSKDDCDLANLRAAIHGQPMAYVDPGTYRKLVVRDVLMMSNTPLELRTNRGVVRRAHGDVLIAGLGLGVILHPIAAKPDVRSVTVVELSPDVVALAAPSLPAKVHVVTADVFDWRPARGTKYQAIYFDIWPTIDQGNLREMTTLARRFARFLDRTDPEAWMGSWMRDFLRAQRRRENRRPWSTPW